jgi:Integrase core domain/HTH-like domain
MVLLTVTSWLDRQEREILAYLIEENRVLRRQLGGRRPRLTDDDRRQLAARAHRLGRQALREIATIVAPDTLLRWHRQLIARKWTYAKKGTSRRGVLAEIRQLVRRMAAENPTWGYTRIQGALKNVGHRAGRSTIARILRAHGIPPAPERPRSWQTLLRAHWGEIAGADFFTTEVWTWRGLVTFYTVFVIELASRRVEILGSTPHPDEAFMRQVARTLTRADGQGYGVLICDRDATWGESVRARLQEGGLRVIQTPYRAPNANAHAERFVRSIKEECLDRLIPFGEEHFRRAVAEFVTHYHRERNHQGLGNELIELPPGQERVGRIRRRSRLGGCSTTTPALRDRIQFSVSAQARDTTEPELLRLFLGVSSEASSVRRVSCRHSTARGKSRPYGGARKPARGAPASGHVIAVRYSGPVEPEDDELRRIGLAGRAGREHRRDWETWFSAENEFRNVWD